MKKATLILLLSVSFSVVVTLSVLLPTLLLKKDPPPSNNNGTTTQQPPSDDNTPAYELSADGKYLYFGEYPQTIKADDVTIVSETPDSAGYYLGDDGERYYKHTVNFDLNKIGSSNAEWSNLNMTELSNGYKFSQGDTLYFKVEKLKWRILSQNADEYLILCENIIYAIAYQQNYLLDTDSRMHYLTDDQGNIRYKEDNITPIYANNYKYSDIRNFLNNLFYNQAFNSKEKEIIKLTEVDNSLSTTSISDPKFICENTNDYIFILSYADVINSNYGFKNSSGAFDLNRRKFTTDLAKATGAYTYTQTVIENDYGEPGSDDWDLFAPYIDTGSQILRSPAGSGGLHLSSSDLGIANRSSRVFDFSNGIAPALNIKIS